MLLIFRRCKRNSPFKRISSPVCEAHSSAKPEYLNVWGLCVLSPPTSCCSHMATRVCAPCRCTPDSSPHASPPLCNTSDEWHSTCTPTRCCYSCGHQILAIASWYRCVATRASGSKCSASTPVYLMTAHLFTWQCATRVCCSKVKEWKRCTCST